MKLTLAGSLGLSFLLALSASAEVRVQTEQLNPADPAWKFKTIPGPSKSDLGAGARITLTGNQLEPAAADGAILVNGVLPADSLDLTESALLSNANTNTGRLVLDLGSAQPIAAVATYSWHEWEADHGSRGPQVYTLYGSAAERPDPDRLEDWVRIARIDTRPNPTGNHWNGQHGVWITDSTGSLGQFRYLQLALERTHSPLQANPGLTGTLFAEIDVHSTVSLARAGDAQVARPADVDHVWVVFKTHLDIGYTHVIDEVLTKYREEMMERALEVIDASSNLPPAQRFSWTLAGWPLSHVLGPQQEPGRRARIEKAIQDGAITFHALPFTTHTETQDLEDLVRSLGYSTRLAQRFHQPLPIGAKMTDVPSHSWILPTLMVHAGARFLQLGCNDVSAYVRVPHLFWWEGPDGSRLLCNYTRVYGSRLTPPRDWPCKNYLAMVMTYDNVGPPSPADVDRLRQQAARDLPHAKVHFGTLDDFARAVLAENPDLPVLRADMPDTWIHGWLSMPQEAKTVRLARPLEPATEALDTQLRAWGVSTPDLAPALAEAYEQSALFSEHTFGPWGPNGASWNSGTPRYLYGEAWRTAFANGAYRKYEAAFDDKRAFARRADALVRRELDARLDRLARSVQTDGERLVVYNALPWKRSGLVEIPGHPGRLFFAPDVPAGGYRTYRVEASQPASVASPEPTLETPFFKLTFDLKRGGIASMVDKRTGRELVDPSSPYALGQFLHERFDNPQMLAFHRAYGRAGYSWPKGDVPDSVHAAALTPPSWTLAIQRDPCCDRVILEARDSLGLAGKIELEFLLPAHQPSIEVAWRVTDKTPDPLPEGGWLCFPFAIDTPRFRLGRLGGPIDPTTDIVPGANRHYFCLNTGLTVTGPDGFGLGLCPLDSPCVSLGEPGLWKFSLEDVPRKPSVFVNLYNNEWNTNFPEWQGGSWSSRVRLWLNAPDADLAHALVTPAWEARLPLLAATADGPGGKLPSAQSGLDLSRPGVLVTAFGANPDGQGTLLRVWEQSGQNGPLAVTLPGPFTTATPVNLRGEKTGLPVTLRAGQLVFNLPAYAPASFVLN